MTPALGVARKVVSMLARTSLLIALVGLLLAVPGRASACGGGGPLAVGLYAFAYPSIASAGVANLVYTVNDIARGRRMTKREGIGEVVTMVPALIIGATTMGMTMPAWTSGAPTYSSFNFGFSLFALAETVWSGALLVHGATVIHRARAAASEAPEVKRPQPPAIALSPTATTGPSGTTYGAMLSGRF